MKETDFFSEPHQLDITLSNGLNQDYAELKQKRCQGQDTVQKSRRDHNSQLKTQDSKIQDSK